MDRNRDGDWTAAGPARAWSEYGIESSSGGRYFATYSAWAVNHDVPGSRQGPIRPARHSHWRPQATDQLAGAQLGAWSRVDVRARLATATRPARLPHRPDHRRLGALHRHGDHLERPRLR